MTTTTVFAGFGGQGVLLMGYLLAMAAMNSGREVTYLPAYGAEMRGGTANCTVVVSSGEIASPVSANPDIAVVMNNPSLIKFSNQVRQEGVVIVNDSLVHSPVRRSDLKVYQPKVSELAHELGFDRSANVVMMGAYAQITGVVSIDALKEALNHTGLVKKEKILEINRRALEVGAEAVS